MAGFRAVRLHAQRDETTGLDWPPLRHAFGINAWRADAGQEVIGRHDEHA